MQIAPHPPNETERLKRLCDLDILDTDSEQEYDDLTQLAAHICDAPIALITLVDRDRQFFKSRHGLDINQAERDLGFCPHAILVDEITIIEDATKDERFYDNPYVTDGLRIRFYAGAPLKISDDICVGTICIVDTKPRTLTSTQINSLNALARQVVSLFKLRQTVNELEISNQQRADALALQRQSERREHDRGVILEMLANDVPLSEVLEKITQSIELELKGAHCSILLLSDDGKQLLSGAAPSLPEFYNEAIHGLEIGPEVGSCGTAAYTGQRVIVEDLATHPYWAAFKDLAIKANLAACWSEPIMDADKNVLGTFAIYYCSPTAPDEAGLSIIEYAAKLAGIAIMRKNREKQLIATKLAAEEANRIKTDFLSIMSHELRTPLTSIQGSIGLMLGGAVQKLSPKSYAMLDITRRNSERLLSLINDLLDIGKIEAGKMEFNFQKENLVKLLQQSIEANTAYAMMHDIELKLTIPDKPVYALVDANRFAQVMANLISNAVKFSHKNSSVDVILQKHKAHCRISVQDYGIGITADFQQHIFEKFSRHDSSDSRERDGTGLGLAITQYIVNKMQGEINFETTPGSGSKFYFDLPLA